MGVWGIEGGLRWGEGVWGTEIGEGVERGGESREGVGRVE